MYVVNLGICVRDIPKREFRISTKWYDTLDLFRSRSRPAKQTTHFVFTTGVVRLAPMTDHAKLHHHHQRMRVQVR